MAKELADMTISVEVRGGEEFAEALKVFLPALEHFQIRVANGEWKRLLEVEFRQSSESRK